MIDILLIGSAVLINLLNGIIVMAIFAMIVEFVLYKIDKGMAFFALFKAAFYGALAFFIYALAKKTGIGLSSPEDWLTVFTYILAVFETAHNLMIFVNSFRCDK